MDNKVWAIVAIIAFHLSLMWFLRGSLKPEELARASHPDNPDVSPIYPNPYLAPPVLLREQAAVADDTKPTAAEDLALVPRKSRPSTVRHRKHPSLRRGEKLPVEKDSREFAARTMAVTPPVFNDTIISVKHSPAQTTYPIQSVKLVEPKAVVLADVRPIEKRKSFLKRAGRVIRKPYDWVKTLVSKL